MDINECLETLSLEKTNCESEKKAPSHIKGHLCIHTARTEEDVIHQVNDGHDVFYSKDRKKLINATGQLTTYSVLYGTQVICHGAFCDTFATEIKLPDTVLAFGYNPFGNTHLKRFIIPKNVRHIETVNPFASCYSLEELIVLSPHFRLEHGVLYTSDYKICYGAATKSCPKDLRIHEGTEIIANNAFFRRKLNSVYIPNSMKEIGKNAFAYTGLKDITLPHSITQISEACFQCCNLVNVTIPELVTNIHEDAFSGNANLKSITMMGRVKSIAIGALSLCPELMKITGPYGSPVLNLKTMQVAGLDDRQHSKRESCEINGKKGVTMTLT